MVAEKPAPKAKPAKSGDDDDFAAFLLEGDEGPTGISPTAVPAGSTIMQMGVVRPDSEAPQPNRL